MPYNVVYFRKVSLAQKKSHMSMQYQCMFIWDSLSFFMLQLLYFTVRGTACLGAEAYSGAVAYSDAIPSSVAGLPP